VTRISRQSLSTLLETKYLQYNTSAFIQDDPVQIPHLFRRKEDIEIAAFLTATIAWGRREQIIINARKLMEWMDYDPFRFIVSHKDRDRELYKKYYYRTFNGNDCAFFLQSLQNIYRNHGGLQGAFSCVNQETVNTLEQIVAFRKLFFELPHLKRNEKHISDPLKNSCCKRINLFLRWMVRKDNSGVDFGIWEHISPARLICPLDVHTSRIARSLGLINRKQDNWQAAVELTEQLKKYDATDPVKFDFALFGLGMYEKF
jgi:uncharacterized protein (TIGR02757 family)